MSQAPRDDLSTGEDSGWQDLDLAWAGEILVKDKAGPCGQALLKRISVIKKELATDGRCKAHSGKHLSWALKACWKAVQAKEPKHEEW
jgi:hypothetical protein